MWGQHRQGLGQGHLKTLAGMLGGLLPSRWISLTAWAPYVPGRALVAQRIGRRCERWLPNPRIEVHVLYGPLPQQALSEWGTHGLYLALAT